MIIVCPSCQARYRFDESRLAGKPRARTRCARCSGVIDIVNPALEPPPDEAARTLPPATPAAAPAAAPATAPPDDTAAGREVLKTDPGSMTGHDIQATLELPKDRRFSLAVIQGAATGQIFPLASVRTTIGRSGSDIDIDDPEASRQHASLEIVGENAVLRDLGSTNGTYVDNARIEQQVLQNHMEFRIGSHVLMLIVTKLE
jgi:predicted Zn finger-like uncharacterized protein